MHLKLKGHLNMNSTNPTEYSRQLTANLLQHINVKYQFSKMYMNSKRVCTDFGCSDSTLVSRPTDNTSNDDSRYITVYLAGQTIADNQLCLIQFSWYCSAVNIKKNDNEHEIISNIFCNSTNIFRKNLSTCIEKIILS
ncbi:unnamed protein product [Trichobilharzia regenti]|nr:unnamed protein product [Trichobilharzia regenti]